MTRLERARMILLFATWVGLLAVACVYAQAAVWPVAALLGMGAVVLRRRRSERPGEGQRAARCVRPAGAAGSRRARTRRGGPVTRPALLLACTLITGRRVLRGAVAQPWAGVCERPPNAVRSIHGSPGLNPPVEAVGSIPNYSAGGVSSRHLQRGEDPP